MPGPRITARIENTIARYEDSLLKSLVDRTEVEPLAIKFVSAKWAKQFQTRQPLNISKTPALTWGTATYVTPLAFPLSSVLYGRIGLVSDFDPTGWRIFDATSDAAQRAYISWAQAQLDYPDLMLTVHSTFTNQSMRDRFRTTFKIDCVLFHPDQEADLHTNKTNDVWMAVTDWLPAGEIATGPSARLSHARFTVLIDEEFDLLDAGGLPIQIAERKIESITETAAFRRAQTGMPVSRARRRPLGADIARHYLADDGYLHIYVEP